MKFNIFVIIVCVGIMLYVYFWGAYDAIHVISDVHYWIPGIEIHDDIATYNGRILTPDNIVIIFEDK